VRTDSVNHRFVYTNKTAGFFLGNSHSQNSSGFEGWTVNEHHVLRDYLLLLNGKPLKRSKIRKFIYDPVSFTRVYENGLTETFTLLDSLDFLLLEIQLPGATDTIGLIPVFHQPQATPPDTVGKRRCEVTLPVDRFAGFSDTLRIRYWPGKKRSAYFSFSLERKGPDSLEELLRLRNARRARIGRFLGRQSLRVDQEEINQALQWSLLAADALVSRQRGTGIWAGLPWFNNYWGRDTFISFGGTLLVTGNFSAAREILKNFASFQFTDPNKREYGRIPNRVTNREVIYNTTDGTWWFLRALYEYYLYSGDESLVKELFPVVKRAVRGAMAKRTDSFGFLTHEDAETWMDAKGAQGAWSPRGNRAVEIQALWYTALRIAGKMARLHGKQEHRFAADCDSAASHVKEQFNHYFWNERRQCLYDHLNADGSPDTSLRPNQIFAVTVPALPGIEPLLSEGRQRKVARYVTEQLTTEWGVLSLWYKDRYFHPFHHYQPYYVPDEAYHNGLIWTWLAGPVIEALLKFDQFKPAAALYQKEAWQILHLDALGNYSELLEPVPRKGAERPQISGTVSQAWSVAEFNRNFYQHIVGYRPNVPERRFVLSPKLLPGLGSVEIALPFGSALLRVGMKQEEDTFQVNLRLEGESEPVAGEIILPGQEAPVLYRLKAGEKSWSYSTRRSDVKQKLKSESWSLARIPQDQTFPVLKKPPYDLASAQEIYFPEEESGRIVLKQNDPPEDDRGPNGRYVYPQNPAFKPGILDLSSLTVYDLNDCWGFQIELRNLTDPGWHPEYGFQLTFLALAIRDVSLKEPLGREIGHGAGVALSAGRAFNQVIYVGGGIELSDGTGKKRMAYIPLRPGYPLGNAVKRHIRFKIKKSYLPGLDARTRITVLCGAQDDHGGAGIGDFREVKREAGEWHGGGAPEGKTPCRVYDRMKIN